MRGLLLAIVLTASACSKEPRSMSFFEVNNDERARVLASCVEGTTENGECAVAQAVESRKQQAAKMSAAKQSMREASARDRAKARSGR